MQTLAKIALTITMFLRVWDTTNSGWVILDNPVDLPPAAGTLGSSFSPFRIVTGKHGYGKSNFS